MGSGTRRKTSGRGTVFPESWLDDLRYEPAVEVVGDDATVKVKFLAAA